MDSTSARILVVDDDPLNRQLLVGGLEHEGYAVLQSANGQKALTVLAADLSDLVITDIEMPEMDGYALLEHRARDGRLREIPFIVISGVEEMASVVRCSGLGAEDYLPKPFDAVLLRARILPRTSGRVSARPRTSGGLAADAAIGGRVLSCGGSPGRDGQRRSSRSRGCR